MGAINLVGIININNADKDMPAGGPINTDYAC
jgi:hypothetical protein